jgi:hypothetical protein
MLILFVAAALAMLIAGGAALTVVFLCRRWVRSQSVRAMIVIPVAGAVFMALVMPIASWLWAQTVTEGRNVPREDYTGFVGPPLPKQAEDITYYSDFSSTEAIFSLPEEAFHQWAKDNGWPVRVLDSPETVELGDLNCQFVVEDGCMFDELLHPRGTSVMAVFDRSTGRCYWHHSAY